MDGKHCIANDGHEEIDVADNFRVVLRFGYEVWLGLSVLMLLSCFSWAHLCLATINICSKIFVTMTLLALLVFMSVYIFSWSGVQCSEEGAGLEVQGAAIKNLFIANVVLTVIFSCFSGFTSFSFIYAIYTSVADKMTKYVKEITKKEEAAAADKGGIEVAAVVIEVEDVEAIR